MDAGICFPDCWPKKRRHLPGSLADEFIPKARDLLNESCGGQGRLLWILSALAAGKIEAPPIGEKVVGSQGWLSDKLGLVEERRVASPGQSFFLDIAGELVRFTSPGGPSLCLSREPEVRGPGGGRRGAPENAVGL